MVRNDEHVLWELYSVVQVFEVELLVLELMEEVVSVDLDSLAAQSSDLVAHRGGVVAVSVA